MCSAEPRYFVSNKDPAPAPAPFYLSNLEEILKKKIMVAKEVYVNYYNFNPIWIQHASIQVKKVLVLKSKMLIVKVSYMIYSETESEPKEIFSAPQY
jgi:hypothetical protein